MQFASPHAAWIGSAFAARACTVICAVIGTVICIVICIVS